MLGLFKRREPPLWNGFTEEGTKFYYSIFDYYEDFQRKNKVRIEIKTYMFFMALGFAKKLRPVWFANGYHHQPGNWEAKRQGLDAVVRWDESGKFLPNPSPNVVTIINYIASQTSEAERKEHLIAASFNALEIAKKFTDNKDSPGLDHR